MKKISILYWFPLMIVLLLVAQPLGAINTNQSSSNWTSLNPALSPPKKNHLAMSFDQSAGELVLFGGRNFNGTLLEDTWSYNYGTNEWKYLNPTNSPPGRQYSDMVYISAENKSALFGGSNTGGLRLADFWLYDYNSNSWEELIDDYSPYRRAHHSLAYSPVDNIMLLAGGSTTYSFADSWIYDFDSNQWLEIGNLPIGISRHSVSYYPLRNSFLLFGYLENLIFELNMTSLTWDVIETSNSPGKLKTTIDTIYEPTIDKFVLFGGWTGEGTDETWLFDYDTLTWYLLETKDKPAPRHTDSNVEYDTVNNVTLLFGGSDENIYYDDTWALSIVSDLDVSTLPTTASHAISSIPTTDSETTESSFPYLLLISLVIFPIIKRYGR